MHYAMEKHTYIQMNNRSASKLFIFLIETIKSTNICRTDGNNDGHDMQLYEQKLVSTLSYFKVIMQSRK